MLSQLAEQIAIIDDDDEMRSLLKEYLDAEGYRTHEFSRAPEALKSLGETPVDLVISDVYMPGMNGIEFLEKFQQNTPNTPVIMITAFGTRETSKKAMERGAFAYIEKPFELAKIRSLVSNAIGAKRA